MIAGVRIYPGFFKQRKVEVDRPQIPLYIASAPIKRTVTSNPSAPKAKYLMPIIPIAMAVGSIVAGVGAYAAATTVIGAVLAGAMVVGGAATLIGVATGNKNLIKYGGILSAVGGIGTAAIGMFGGAEGAATAGLDTAESLSGPTTTGYEGDGLLGGADTAVTEGGASGVATGGGPGGAAPPALAAPPPEINPVVPDPIATPNATVPSNQASAQYQLPDGSIQKSFSAPDAPTSITQTPKGFFNQAGQWIKDNPELAKIGAQVGTGLLSNMSTSPAQEAQINLADSQAESIRQSSARAAQRADWGRGISKPLSSYLGK